MKGQVKGDKFHITMTVREAKNLIRSLDGNGNNKTCLTAADLYLVLDQHCGKNLFGSNKNDKANASRTSHCKL
jgi:hypothetical protein